MRTALLASLGRDLRTLLTGIQGAAGTLRGAWNKPPAAMHVDLPESIEQDVDRTARFLTTITLPVFDSVCRAQRGDRVELGSDLGLAIARGMIEASGGRIAAHRPRPEKPADGLPGTVVSITLPLAGQSG